MFGYLDPASGSMILSVVAAGAAGIAVFFKSFGHRLWSSIAFWKKDDAVAAAPPTDETSAETSAETSV